MSGVINLALAKSAIPQNTQIMFSSLRAFWIIICIFVVELKMLEWRNSSVAQTGAGVLSHAGVEDTLLETRLGARARCILGIAERAERARLLHETNSIET